MSPVMTYRTIEFTNVFTLEPRRYGIAAGMKF